MKEKVIAMLKEVANGAGDNYDKMAYKMNKTDMAFGGSILFARLKNMTKPEMLDGLKAALMSCETIDVAINAAADYIVSTRP